MKRSKFSLSHYKLFTCDMGELIPAALIEVLPGDTIQQSTNLLVRCSPLLAPVMHPVHVRIHHWFVPHRLVWDKWEDFITGGPDGLDSTAFPTTPALSGVVNGSLFDYLGVPPGIAGVKASALPFRAYQTIWNEHYRDQDLESEVVVHKGNGDDGLTSYDLQNCSWEKDYFTSARPWPQKGPIVTLPLGTSAPVERKINAGPTNVYVGGTQSPPADNPLLSNSGKVGTAGATGNISLGPGASGDWFANLSNASAVTVTALREALAIQRYEEARARYGSRYVEYLRYLGIRSSDARLQRPEYLGGGRNTIQFSEVLQTGPSADASSVVGGLKGHGISAVRSNRYRRFFEEHGYVLTLVSILPKTMYSQGLARTWNRRAKDDFWQREFQHVGQQEVLNKEIYVNHATPDGIFGYQDRYDEYRRMESSIAGDFRSTLNFWHFARDFASAPALNASFVKAVPTERTFASNTADVLWVMARHSIQARRMVARTGESFIY